MVDSPYKYKKGSGIYIDSQKTTKGTEYTREHKTERDGSKISNRITKSILEKEKNCLENPTDYERVIEEEKSAEENNIRLEEEEIIISEPIKVTIVIELKKKTVIKSILLKITNKITIEDLIKESVQMFNQLFAKDRIPYKLNENHTVYSIKPSKKSGKADLDLPKLNIQNLIYQTNLRNFTLLYEKEDLFLIKKRESFMEKCKHCLIM